MSKKPSEQDEGEEVETLTERVRSWSIEKPAKPKAPEPSPPPPAQPPSPEKPPEPEKPQGGD
jgi:hypothetical protein